MSPTTTILVVLPAAAAGFLLVYTVSTWLVRELEPGDARSRKGATARLRSRRLWTKMVDRVRRLLPGRIADRLHRQIVMAGGLGGLSPAELVLRALGAVLLALSGGLLVVALTRWTAWLVLATTVLAALLPFLWLRDRVNARHQAILRDLAFHLDLLTLSVEAGLDFGAAVGRIVRQGRPGPLRDELSVFLGEIRIGKTRVEAMRSMSERVGLPALASFLGSLIQADRLGTGIGKTLRLQADGLRDDRFNRAEKAANEAPVKMLLPLVIFVFPTIWIILAAPLVFEWIVGGAP